MARTTRSDSNRDTASRQTTRRSSTDTANTRGAASTQPNAKAQTNQASQPSAQDRERSIETRDETSRVQGQTGGTGVSRQGSRVFGAPPLVGGVDMNPFAAVRRWSEDMDRLFQDFGLGQLGLGRFGGRLVSSLNDVADWSPQVEAFQRGDKFVVRADLPGMKKDDVKVEVENNTLTISGERTDEREEKREGYYRSERSYGQFYRAIPLPEGVNAEQCDATFKDGVLEVSLKAPQQREKSRQIPIR